LAAESSTRVGVPSTYVDRVFANAINIVVKTTEQNYTNCMFREALKSGFYNLQAARDEYRSTYNYKNKDNIEDYNHDLVAFYGCADTSSSTYLSTLCRVYSERYFEEGWFCGESRLAKREQVKMLDICT